MTCMHYGTCLWTLICVKTSCSWQRWLVLVDMFLYFMICTVHSICAPWHVCCEQTVLQSMCMNFIWHVAVLSRWRLMQMYSKECAVHECTVPYVPGDNNYCVCSCLKMFLVSEWSLCLRKQKANYGCGPNNSLTKFKLQPAQTIIYSLQGNLLKF